MGHALSTECTETKEVLFVGIRCSPTQISLCIQLYQTVWKRSDDMKVVQQILCWSVSCIYSRCITYTFDMNVCQKSRIRKIIPT